ncbi:MAG: thiol protease/hemagglutinin PrtT [Tannerellaceae bacterium]|jgi:hypothetical protein|nr:thiol protease/hemagglutinin PrtT [Tannerellaceae bacterium]
MKKITTLALLLLLLNGANLRAKIVEQDKAFRVASRFVAAYSDGLRSSSSIELVYTAVAAADSGLRAAAERPLFYVYNVHDKAGFVIVAGDDQALPVLAYAGRGEFGVDSRPANLQKWLSVYEKEISGLIEKEDTPSAEILQKWEALLKGDTPAPSALVLLPTAQWDQTEPYNNLCPIDSGRRALAGCVATAMGIVMKYHQWPEEGKGSHSYTTSSRGIPLTADFNVAYDWGTMPDVYSRSWDATQRKAVAELIYHCGVAANMDYTYEASGSTEWEAAHALTTYFGYDKGLCMSYRELYTREEWHELLRHELDQDRPVLYGGTTKNEEGHLFVIDGYDSRDYFHVNWGWSGIADGYYLLSALEPQLQGAGGSKEGEGYDFQQDAIIGLQKETRLSRPNHEFYFLEDGDFDVYGLSTDVDIITRDKPFRLRFSYVFDYGRRDFDGTMGFFIVDKNGNRKTELETFRYSLEAGYVVYDTEGETYTITSDVEKGDKIRMYYNSNGQEWKPVRGTQHTVVELPVEVPLLTSNEAAGGLFPAAKISVAAGGTLDILLSDKESLQAATIFDLSGRLLKELDLPHSGGSHVSCSLYDLPPGIYILSLQITENTHFYRTNHIFLNKLH